jgi:SAM-dependent methyltransferase
MASEGRAYANDEPMLAEEDYTPEAFAHHFRNLQEHFWYLGRSRFILRAFERESESVWGNDVKLRAIDLGGGAGGWIRYLHEHAASRFDELILTDTSQRVLDLAASVVPAKVPRIRTDLQHLPWDKYWDVAFMLDVLEHVGDDAGAMQQAREALRPGGLLFVTCPALRFFWSFDDVSAHHHRRYSRADLEKLAMDTGFEVRTSRYFMFFLSPLLWLSRLGSPDLANMTGAQIEAYKRKHTHRLPPRPINWLLRAIFAAETPLGLWLPFPWGTSVLGVFQKPA